ncbi:MAG: hypothetical protein WCG66_08405 [bacterium]
MENLGISGCLADATEIHSASWNDNTGILAEFQAPGCGISRWKLDDLLQKRFQSLGGTLITNSRVAPGQGVVWAAGRPRRSSRWLGLKGHVRNLALTHDLEMFTSPQGYIGMVKIEHGLVNVCGLFKIEPPRGRKGWDLLLEILRTCSLHNLADRLKKADVMDTSFCGVAAFELGPQDGPAFRIGDSSSMIPPFTGNGMSMALESAECALQPALDYATGRKSWIEASSACAAAQAARFRRRLAAAEALHSLLMNPLALRCASVLARRKCLPFPALLHLVR